jgi:AmmeMemoRadiSam system protein B
MNRQPAVAGVFYPVNSVHLHQMINDYLKDVKSDTEVPKAIIAPHAGYIYSGPVAASVYARMQHADMAIKRVVLLGPSHRVAFRGLAVTSADTFSMPFGNVSVDADAIAKLARYPFVHYLDQAHEYEHSLEVHLPFLQHILKDFTIIPIVTGDASPEEVATVIESLWGGPETLVVISSDLSHYHDYSTAKKLDNTTSHYIETKRSELLSSEAACGKLAISGLLKVARKMALPVHAVDVRNSGDTAGDKKRVVGYGSYVIG